MKKLSAVLIAILAVSPAFAAEIPAVSKISKVTVYSDRALVTRTAEVKLEPGANTIVFDKLPGALIEESLRAEGRGSVAVTMQGAELKKVYTERDADPRVAALQAELETLRDERRAIETRREALRGQREFLDSIKNFSSAQVPKEIQTRSSPSSEWTGLSQYLLDGYTQNRLADLEVEKQLREKDRQILAKERELSELYGGGADRTRTALVNVEAKGQGTFTVELSYLIQQATWSVSYDAKIRSAKKVCDLVSYGNVRQWTGEDWTDVSITLSSAKPSIGGRMPELTPWYVDFYYPPAPQPVYAMARKAAREESYAMMDAAAPMASAGLGGGGGSAPIEAEAAQAEVSQELSSVTFTVARPVTVPADNSTQKFPVQTETLPVSLDYEATPKLSPYAFLHSKVTNDKDYAFLSGPMNVFADNSFIGNSWLASVGRGEKFDLYLGIDEEIKVKRTPMKDKQKKSMLGLRARKDYAFKMEVENYKKEAVKVTLIDQLPQSRHNDIKAELIQSLPKPTETKDLGIARWELELAPAEKKSVEFSFFVEYPSDKTVTGV